MPDARQLGDRRSADPLRRRVGRDELRPRRLERLQLPHERVELRVGDLRPRLDVVEPLVPADLGPELFGARRRVLRLRGHGAILGGERPVPGAAPIRFH